MQLIRRGYRALLSLALASVVVVPAGLATPALAQQGSPDRLTDPEFWKLSSECSEADGFFQSENYLSNEMAFQFPIPELQRTIPRGAAYLGVGPEQNFTYIAALHPGIAFILDVRRGNLLEQLIYKSLFELAPDRAEFLSLLFSRPRPPGLDSTSTVDHLFEAYASVPSDSLLYRRTLRRIEEHLQRTHGFPLRASDLQGITTIFSVFAEGGPDLSYSFGQQMRTGFNRGMPSYALLMTQTDGNGTSRSYLASEAAWREVRSLEERNLIVPVVGDFGGPKALRAIGGFLHEHGVALGAFYTSNVEQYLFRDNSWSAFYANVATLPIDSTSRFIRSGRRSSSGYGTGRGFGGLSESLIASVADLLKAVDAHQVQSWQDVLALSH